MFPKGFQKGLLCGPSSMAQFMIMVRIALRPHCKEQEQAAHMWTEDRSEDAPLKLHLNVFETKWENLHQEHQQTHTPISSL